MCLGGGPAGKQLQSVLARRTGLCGVDDKPQITIGRGLEDLVGEFDVSHCGVSHTLRAREVLSDVVSGPTGPELFTLGGQLSDEIG